MPSDEPQDYQTGHKEPATATRPKNGRQANPRRRGRATGLAEILQSALDEPAAAEGGGRRRPSNREMVINRLVEKSAGADLAATKLLFELLAKGDIEARAGTPADAEPFSRDALDELKERLARLAAAASAVGQSPSDPAASPDEGDDAAGEAIEAEGRGPP